MKFAPKSIAVGVALFVIMSLFAEVAYAKVQEASVVPAVQPVSEATNTPIQTKAPDDWIVFDDTIYMPVVDTVSRHLNEARKAFDAKDNKKAATEMRAVADELKLQAARVDEANKAQIKVEKALVAADTEFTQEAINRINASTLKIDLAAEAIEIGEIKTKAELDKVIDKTVRADMDRRWLVTDLTAWYPISEEPQRQFTEAVIAYAKKDYRAAATEIRQAAGYLRLEAGRATSASEQELNSAVAQLDMLADSIEKGVMKDEQLMSKAFAKANHALAVEHRSKALEAWARKNYDKAGYELKAAAHNLESAVGWVGEEAKKGVAATVADSRALSDKLISGANWTREEVAKGLEVLGHSLNELGQKISPSHT